MKREVIFSVNAKNKLQDLLEYLEFKWSVRVRDGFIFKLDSSIEIIKNLPESFPKSQIVTTQYRCVVTKQTTIYYKFDENQIKVFTIFDTRQNPKKLKDK